MSAFKARLRSMLVSGTIAVTVSQLHGCSMPECAQPDYANPECRVVAENEAARLELPGLDVRFHDPQESSAASWDALGVLHLSDEGALQARVAGAGPFAVSITPAHDGPQTLEIQLDNVDPSADITIGPAGNETLVSATDPGLQRTMTADLSDGETLFIRGQRDCPDRHRLAVTADIQTNPDQFRRILQRLQTEARDAEAAGEPLVTLVIAGDLTEASRDDEFEAIQELLRQSPVPVAVTPGNHDIFRTLRPHFNDRFGPGNYAFTVCDTKVVLVDTGSGFIARSIQARLPEMLERGDARHLILGMHHPPHPAVTGSGWSREDAAQFLLAQAAQAEVDLLVAGHNHALRELTDIDVAGGTLREVIVGTAGAYQGLGVPQYGYLRVVASPQGLRTCFVEVPAPGFDGPPNDGVSDTLPYCED